MVIRTLLMGILLSLIAWTAPAQEGYAIEVELDGHTSDSLFLAYYYGDRQYIKDTVARAPDGTFTFAGEDALPPGMYLIVLPPDNQYFQILVEEGDQHFGLHSEVGDLTRRMRVEGSEANARFYDYLRFLDDRRQEATALGEQGVASDAPEVQAITERVEERQQQILDEHPESFTAAIIRANQSLEPPAFSGSETERQEKQWRYVQRHYFDNLDLADPRLLRTPFLFERVNYFVNKLQVQHPDTLSAAIDTVLARMRPAPETFKFYLIHFLNTYAGSKVVGMDAVYVHLAEQYYARGAAPWTDPDQLEKIVANAEQLKPLLIGKVAPDITVQRRDGSRIALHEVEAPYTVLYFWRYDCGHCKQSTPHLKTFFEEYAEQGVEIFAVCVKKDEEEIAGCWDYVDDQQIGAWIHTVDPGYRSLFPVKYYIQSTPQVYVLGPDKTILSKRIGAEQLPEVMDRLMADTGSSGE